MPDGPTITDWVQAGGSVVAIFIAWYSGKTSERRAAVAETTAAKRIRDAEILAEKKLLTDRLTPISLMIELSEEALTGYESMVQMYRPQNWINNEAPRSGGRMPPAERLHAVARYMMPRIEDAKAIELIHLTMDHLKPLDPRDEKTPAEWLNLFNHAVVSPSVYIHKLKALEKALKDEIDAKD